MYGLPQRGRVDLTFSLQYNNKGFRLLTNCPTQQTCTYKPAMERGYTGKLTFVTMLGTYDRKNMTFHVKGSMTYGFSVDKAGNVNGSPPRLATPREQREAMAVVRSEFPSWKIY